MSITITDTLKFRESVNDDWQRLLIQANINFNLIYPVGSIYMSTVNVDPGTLFGGTWEQLEDRFLLGAGSTYTAGDTGGEAEHTLTVDEMPNHTHPYWSKGTTAASGGSFWADAYNGSVDFLFGTTSSTGGGQAHNNMPPYIVVYMWKRLTLSPALTPLPMNVLGDVASEDIVPVAKGGTGADNAAEALTNLGIYKENLPLSLSKSSGTGSVKDIYAWKYGNVVHVVLGFQTSGTTNAGSNVYVGTYSGIPLPQAYCATGVGQYASSAICIMLTNLNDIVIRVTGQNLSQISGASEGWVTVTYIV